MTSKGLLINRETHSCRLFEEEISLTPIEFSVLWYLCENRGKVVSSEELFEAVWKEKYLDNNNTVMAHIGRLREKLHEPAKKPRFIKTVWGVGGTRLKRRVKREKDGYGQLRTKDIYQDADDGGRCDSGCLDDL